MSGKCHAAAALSPGKNPFTNRVGSWVGPTAGLEVLEKTKNILSLLAFEPWIVQHLA